MVLENRCLIKLVYEKNKWKMLLKKKVVQLNKEYCIKIMINLSKFTALNNTKKNQTQNNIPNY